MFSRRNWRYLTGAALLVLSLWALWFFTAQEPRQLRVRNEVLPVPVTQALLAALQARLPDIALIVDQTPALPGATGDQMPDIIFGDLKLMALYGAAEEIPMVRDGVALIVNARNPIRELTAGDIEAIYLRKVRDWKFVGGEETAIDVLRRGSGYAETAAVLRYFNIHALRTIDPFHGGRSGLAIAKVAAEPGTLGFVSLIQAERAQQSGQQIKLLAAQGISATRENLVNGSYGLQRSLGIGLSARCRDLAPAIRQTLQADSVQQALSAAGFDATLRM